MNENVSIKEGNITRKFAPIDKVKVDNTDGTSSIWVPEDDLKTGVLYASENGIYIASEDGYDAYSEVVIRVEKRIDDGDLIDESGTDWKDIDFDGDVGNFDELDNWDVDTLEEFSDDLEGFDDLFNDKDKWDEEKEKPITEDEMGDFDGDSISGIDPETGEDVSYNTDEDGYLDMQYLPHAIDIIHDPYKTSYVVGETIDFYGLIVIMLKADGSPFIVNGNSLVPYNELVFPVKTAPSAEDAGQKEIEYPDYQNTGQVSLTGYVSTKELWDYYWTTYWGFSATAREGSDISVGFSKNPGMIINASTDPYHPPGSVTTGNVATFYSLNIDLDELDKLTLGTVVSASYISIDHVWSYSNGVQVSGVNAIGATVKLFIGRVEYPNGRFSLSGINAVVHEQWYANIPVQWIRSKGALLEQILEDSFRILVTKDGDSGGGSEDGGSEGGDSVLDDNGKFTWKGKNYKANTDIDATVHFSNGIIWVEAGSWGSREYTVDQAYDLGLITIDN